MELISASTIRPHQTFPYFTRYREFWEMVFEYLYDKKSLAHVCTFLWNIAARNEYVTSVITTRQPLLLQNLSFQLSHCVILVDPKDPNPVWDFKYTCPFVETLCVKLCIFDNKREATHHSFLSADRMEALTRCFPRVQNFLIDFGISDTHPLLQSEETFQQVQETLKTILPHLSSFSRLQSFSIHCPRTKATEAIVIDTLLDMARNLPLIYTIFSSNNIMLESDPTEDDYPLPAYFAELRWGYFDHTSSFTHEKIMPILLAHIRGVHPVTGHPMKYPYNPLQVFFKNLEIFAGELVGVMLRSFHPHLETGTGRILANYLSLCKHNYSDSAMSCLLGLYQERVDYEIDGKNCITLAFELALSGFDSGFEEMLDQENEDFEFDQLFLEDFSRWIYNDFLRSMMTHLFSLKYASNVLVLHHAKTKANPFYLIMDFILRNTEIVKRYVTNNLTGMKNLYFQYMERLCRFAKQNGFSLYQVDPVTNQSAADLILAKSNDGTLTSDAQVSCKNFCNNMLQRFK